jgi:predicted ATPase
LLLAETTPDSGAAERSLVEALDTARQQQAKTWELRAAMSLARHWHDRGRTREAHDLLAPIYGWFSEGSDMPHLIEARALLGQLTSAPCRSLTRPRRRSAAPVDNSG